MNELVITTQHFGTAPIRQVTYDDTELWALADICAALGLSHSCSARIPATNKRSCRIATKGGPQQLTFVDLEGFELAVIRSNKPLANTMRSWIHEHKPHTTKETTMATDITTHTFHDTAVRIHTDGDTVEYCARDIATALGYKDTINAIKQHCHGVVKRHPIADTLGRAQEAGFIGEGDVYRLIVSSQLPAAVEFEHWLFDEVLPAIRRDGAYVAASDDDDDEALMARALLAAQRALERREQRIKAQQKQLDEQKPKVALADAISNSTSTILIGELAKILTQNGARDLGTRKLFARLRADGYLCRQHGEMWNLPTQHATNLGLFEVIKRPVSMPDGSVRITRTTKVTGKGQQFFITKYVPRED